MKIRKLNFLVILAGCLPTISTAQTFTFTGTDQTYVVPSGIHGLELSMWGAGGGNSGGGGGYVAGLLPVSPGEVLTMVVGGSAGGVYYNEGVGGRTYGGGGYSWGFSDVLAGVGGGRTAIQLDGIDLVTAGGGGGGSYVTIGAHFRQGGGGGGGLVGGLPEYGSATGGTQTSGGSVNGGLFHGGDPIGPGAGGGGGYYGGGGGSGGNQSQYLIRPAAGGSSFIGNLEGAVTEAGSMGSSGVVLPGGTSDPYYVVGTGVGGQQGVGYVGGSGLIVIRATTVPEPESLVTLFAGLLVLSICRRK